jgi:cardiolipin synthase
VSLATLPNLLSALRILLVLPYGMALLNRRIDVALLLFAVAAATDGIDGWLARRFGWQSRLGAFLDPAADKLLIAVSVVVLACIGFVPLWVAAVVLLRDLVIVAGALTYRVSVGPIEYGATRLGKASTAAQVALVLVVLLPHLAALAGSVPTGVLGRIDVLQGALEAVVVLLALGSGADYVRTWARRWATERAAQHREGSA